MTDDDQDWRLRAQLHGDAGAIAPHGILARFRGPRFVQDAQSAIGPDVVLTHDGSTLFGYAADRGALDRARAPLEAALHEDAISAGITISHWEDDVGDWAQVEPPLAGTDEQTHERLVRDAHAPTTQTFVVNVGKEVRSEFEESMLVWAQKLGVQCELVEHPHLLRTQVAFTVSGPAHAVNELRDGLRAEERATIRTEQVVMASPL